MIYNSKENPKPKIKKTKKAKRKYKTFLMFII